MWTRAHTHSQMSCVLRYRLWHIKHLEFFSAKSEYHIVGPPPQKKANQIKLRFLVGKKTHFLLIF